MTTFSDLGLAAPLLKALEGEGYTAPTPIQAKAIPPIMQRRDLLGIAQTGTGKTAAFALPILHYLANDPRPAPRKGCRVLVLSPTRELATQIADSFRTYGKYLGLTVAVVFGGVAHRPQVQALARGIDVLVATPGRLLDHMTERAADISGTEIFVLDEADQMLDLGFVKPIRRIVSHLSQRRQNLFFSATMPAEISGLAADLLRDPVKVAVAPVATTAERVNQRVILIEAAKKRTLLTELLANPEMTRTLVFTRTKRGADKVARHLETGGTKVAAIHGNKSQRQRENALEDFRTSRINVLVATDIAARGIDIDLVTHVVNFELPEVPEAYVHRIGRTARAGQSGSAISFCDVEERDLLRAIERLTRQQIPHEDRRNDASIVAPPRSAEPPRERDPRSFRGERGRSEHGRGVMAEEGEGARRGAHHRDGAHNRDGASPRDGAPGRDRSFAPRRDHAPRTRDGESQNHSNGSIESVEFLRRPGTAHAHRSDADHRPDHRGDHPGDHRAPGHNRDRNYRGPRPAGDSRGSRPDGQKRSFRPRQGGNAR